MTTLKIEIGQKVHANYGAMHGIEEGMITNIELDGMVTWETEDGKVNVDHAKYFRQPGETSVNGSGIGVYLGEY